MNIYDLRLKEGGLTLRVDDLILDISHNRDDSLATPYAQGWDIPTQSFANGQHTVKISSRYGEEKIFVVSFQNEISNFRYNAVFSPSGDGSVVSQACNVTATFSRTKNWQITIKDYDDNTKRSFTGTGNSLNVTWGGMGNDGLELRDGTYFLSMSVSDAAAAATGSFHLASFAATRRGIVLCDVGAAGMDLSDAPIIKDRTTDSFIVIDQNAVHGGMPTAKRYAKFLEATVSAKYGFSLSDRPTALIVDAILMAVSSSGYTDSSGVSNDIIRWINAKVTSVPLKLFYFCGHGESGYSGGSLLFSREIPFFGLGYYVWASSIVNLNEL